MNYDASCRKQLAAVRKGLMLYWWDVAHEEDEAEAAAADEFIARFGGDVGQR